MESYRVTTAGNVMLNFAEVKCLKRNGNESVTIEFKERYTYLLNPKTKEYERFKQNYTTTFHFDQLDELLEFLTDFRLSWQNYSED